MISHVMYQAVAKWSRLCANPKSRSQLTHHDVHICVIRPTIYEW